ncbi:enterochelin esterase [Stakelama sp. CBK3Z-3]|uniref:Enterochelin esterase n=1 Tax=Stakelama flava TaxID=2860338 RepID=A0ABS6XM97_9SPHN|nr:alpha/beta hydrolase-fold protein [Stakelama flava]MBW4331329.1 enterochelin esterase [Stakelama flava]
MRTISLAAAALLTIAAAPPQAAPRAVGIPVDVAVRVAPDLGKTHSGRLLLFAQKVTPGAETQDTVDTSAFRPTDTAVAGREVTDFRPGHPAVMGTDTDAFPQPFSTLAPGTYRFQAVLDPDHSYTYSGRDGGDLVSKVVEATLPGPVPALMLDHALPETGFDETLTRYPEDRRAVIRAGLKSVRPIDFQSTVMTDFRGTPTAIRGWVALPPGYGPQGDATYPTVYSDGGFGSTLESAKLSAAMMANQMAKGEMPPMIWVYLDHHIATGTHEFADSKNNGPWGTALVTELIPALERQYRMDAKSTGRFLTGHSSGGWSTLWLQVKWPKIFGGNWPTSPDPSDFHDFTNVNLYADNANFYHGPDGKPLPLIRDKGKVIATTREFATLEQALGGYGGQFASFEWVFSPRCPDGRPCPVFDRATGDVDPRIAQYWIDNYDVAHIVKRDWNTLRPDLKGKLHLIVGTADTFYLDGPAHRLQKVLTDLGDTSQFRFIPGRTHFDLFQVGDDRYGLMKVIGKEMYDVARPGNHWQSGAQ